MKKLNGLLAVGITMTLAASCASENSDIRSKDYMFENLTDGAPGGLTQDDELKGSEIIAAGGIPDPVFALASPNKTPAGYRYEGVGFTMQTKGGSPVYALYNSKLKNHVLTKNKGEVNHLERKGYRFRGVAFYEHRGNSVNVYRLSKTRGQYQNDFYTASKDEAIRATTIGYNVIGTAFKAKCIGACESDKDSSINIHRFFNGKVLDHYYNKAGNSASLKLTFSQAGAIKDQFCTQLLETSDPHTWRDNFLCSTKNKGIRFNSAGPINGMKCERLYEGSDLQGTWGDNFLCVPQSSDLKLRWSYRGKLPGLTCESFHEKAEPRETAWHDNYLCY